MHRSHAQVPAASAGHAYGPTGPGSVMLELGEHTGALILEVLARCSQAAGVADGSHP